MCAACSAASSSTAASRLRGGDETPLAPRQRRPDAAQPRPPHRGRGARRGAAAPGRDPRGLRRADGRQRAGLGARAGRIWTADRHARGKAAAHCAEPLDEPGSLAGAAARSPVPAEPGGSASTHARASSSASGGCDGPASPRRGRLPLQAAERRASLLRLRPSPRRRRSGGSGRRRRSRRPANQPSRARARRSRRTASARRAARGSRRPRPRSPPRDPSAPLAPGGRATDRAAAPRSRRTRRLSPSGRSGTTARASPRRD